MPGAGSGKQRKRTRKAQRKRAGQDSDVESAMLQLGKELELSEDEVRAALALQARRNRVSPEKIRAVAVRVCEGSLRDYLRLKEGGREFRLEAPSQIPSAEFPRCYLDCDLNDSDLAFERLFRRLQWEVTGLSGQHLPTDPTDRLADDPAEFLKWLRWKIASQLAPDEPQPLLADRESILSRYDPLSTEVVMLLPTLEVFEHIRELEVTPITDYQCLLAMKWLIDQLDWQAYHEDFIAALKFISGKASRKRGESDPGRLDKTRELFDQILELWEVSRRNGPPPRPTGTPLDSADLGPHLIWAPHSLKMVLRAILAVPKRDLDQEWWESGFPDRRLTLRYAPLAGGSYKPLASRRRDPIAVLAVRALDKVLSSEIAKPAPRRRFIANILDATYPKGYRSPGSPGGACKPTGKWNPETFARWLQG